MWQIAKCMEVQGLLAVDTSLAVSAARILPYFSSCMMVTIGLNQLSRRINLRVPAIIAGRSELNLSFFIL